MKTFLKKFHFPILLTLLVSWILLSVSCTGEVADGAPEEDASNVPLPPYRDLPWSDSYPGAVSGRTSGPNQDPEIRVSVVSTESDLSEQIAQNPEVQVRVGDSEVPGRFLGTSSFMVEHTDVPIYRFAYRAADPGLDLDAGMPVEVILIELVPPPPGN